jgi:hypothetical protein
MYNLVCVKLAWLIGLDNKRILEKSNETETVQSKESFQMRLTERIGLECETNAEPKMIRTLRSIQENIELIREKLQEESIRNDCFILKWKYAAYVMDRFFLYVLTVYFLFSFSLLILVHKNFYNYN